MTHLPVNLSSGIPETVLPEEPEQVRAAVAEALALSGHERVAALRSVAGSNPKLLEAWARLGEVVTDEVEAYAYARVGYHRGLDTLRKSGWKGTGYVRWREPGNRGFLRALEALRRLAAAIGETDEAERCEHFLIQLDPDWKGLPQD